MNNRLEFRPSLQSAAFEASAVALFVVLSFAVIGSFKGVSMWSSLTFGLAFGVVTLAIYLAVYIWRAATVVRLFDNELSIEYLLREDLVSLEDVREAFHEDNDDSFGLQWRLEIGARSVVLRDLGFSATVWRELSSVLHERLRALDKTVVTEGFAEEFIEDGVEVGKANNN